MAHNPTRNAPAWHIVSLALTLLTAAGTSTAPLADETEATAIPDSGTIVREGDILAPAANAIQTRGVGGQSGGLWPGGIMPVWIDPSLSTASTTMIRQAIAQWNEVAGIRIDELASAPGDRIDHVLFESGDGCASWVGRRGGAQSLWVAPQCNVGSLMHELGHAIGLEHEHTRPDRDSWIAVRWDSVLPEKRHNFDRAPDNAPMLGDYDYASIMHYGPDFFSADGNATIEPLLGTAVRIGQRNAPSAGDIDAIAELYGTDLMMSAALFVATPSTLGEQEQPTHDLDLFITNDGKRGAHDLVVTVELTGEWRSLGRHDTLDDWLCEALDTSIACRLERLSAGESARLSLALRDARSIDDNNSTDATRTNDRAPPVGVRLSSGTDDTDASNDTAIVQRVSEGDRSSGGLLVLADGSGSGDGQQSLQTGLGSAGPLWMLLGGLLFARRRQHSPRHCEITSSPVSGSISGS